MNDSKGKTAIVTGASSGIGLTTARLLYEKGASVTLAARSWDKLDEITRDWDKDRCLSVKTDVTIEEDCRRMVEATVEKFGKIDILINNAGLSMRAMFKDLDLKVIKNLMDVNFWGTVNCTKYALQHIIKVKGSIVGVVSIAAYDALPARTGYSASKYAVRGFLDTLRIEHLRDGLHVMVFAPGYTASNVRNAALTADGTPQGETPLDEGKLMSAEKVARIMLRGLKRHRRTMILTPLGKATVLLAKIAPDLLDRLTWRYISREKGSPFGVK